MIDLTKYESAFRLIAGENTNTLPEVVKRALVAIALTVDYGETRHQVGLQELFSRYNQTVVTRTLDAILRIETRRSLGNGVPGLAASPTWNPAVKEELQAMNDTAKTFVERYSDAAINARVRELQHRPEAP